MFSFFIYFYKRDLGKKSLQNDIKILEIKIMRFNCLHVTTIKGLTETVA